MYLAIVSIHGTTFTKECNTLDEAKTWAKEKIEYNGTRHYPHAEFSPSFYRVERITSLAEDLRDATSPDFQHENGM